MKQSMSIDLEQQAIELAERISIILGGGLWEERIELRLSILEALQRAHADGAEGALKSVQKMHDNYCMNSESGMTDPDTGERTFDRYETARIETLEEVMEELRSAQPNGGKET